MEKSPQSDNVYQEDNFWKTSEYDGGIHAMNLEGTSVPAPQLIESADGLEGATEEGAARALGGSVSPPPEQERRESCAEMTIAQFVQARFVPEHVAIKRTSGRTHYQAILKHVLTPEEVDRVFQSVSEGSKAKLKANPTWPYMNDVRLCDAQPDHVQRLISAALEAGYSTQTATHIRNVVSAIFSYAIRERCFTGHNPASHVTLPGMKRKETHALTLAQARQVLEIMQYPEKEMTLLVILTSMNLAEICGLQWKHVNMLDVSVGREGEEIPPRSIVVRKQWYRGELCSVMKGRSKVLHIPQLLLPVLLGLSRRARCIGGDDFVLTSNAGTPINQVNVAARRLKAIGRELQMPWLSWQVFRRTHAALVCEFGMQFHRQMAMVVQSDSQRSGAGTRRYLTGPRLCDPQPRAVDE